MAETTGIAWTTSSWNPWIGCTEVSPGCDNCYARELDKRHRYGGAEHWGVGVPRYRTKQWDQPLKWNKKAAATGQRWTVFPSLCDPFDNEVPVEWRNDLFLLITRTPHLTWLLLTKRIGNVARMIADVGWRDNLWLGVSVVNQEEADRDIPKLLATPAALHFLSLEPQLGPIDLSRFQPFCRSGASFRSVRGILVGEIRWAIVGGESAQGGAKARPFDVNWAVKIIRQCKSANVPVFMKQLGSNPFSGKPYTSAGNELVGIMEQRPGWRLKDRAGANPAEWPENLRVQELPA